MNPFALLKERQNRNQSTHLNLLLFSLETIKLFFSTFILLQDSSTAENNMTEKKACCL